jgi:hypothetical protein
MEQIIEDRDHGGESGKGREGVGDGSIKRRKRGKHPRGLFQGELKHATCSLSPFNRVPTAMAATASLRNRISTGR